MNRRDDAIRLGRQESIQQMIARNGIGFRAAPCCSDAKHAMIHWPRTLA
jgi:hypothetical protein